MWDRLFGRSNDNMTEPSCAACGRSLLPGEWAQTMVGDDGREEIICSLCAQSGAVPEGRIVQEAGDGGVPVSVSGRPKPIKPPQQAPPDDRDAFWRALKEKDAEIDRLRSDLARAEAENQELVGQLTLLKKQLHDEAVSGRQVSEGFPNDEATASSEEHGSPDQETQPLEIPQGSEPGTPPVEEEVVLTEPWETPDATEPIPIVAGPAPETVPAETRDDDAETATPGGAEADDTQPFPSPETYSTGAIPVVEEGPSWLFETPPQQTFGDRPGSLPADGQPREPAAESVVDEAASPADPDSTAVFSTGDSPAVDPSWPEEPEQASTMPSPEEVAAQTAQAALLQRGADLLNVSPVPRKVAETSESLGPAIAHLSSDGESMTALFLWSMAWYEYRVDLDDGGVTLVERGYDDRARPRPNARVRPDGTVLVAPVPTRRPPTPAPLPEPPPVPQPAAGDPRVADSAKADIISKSLKGQRTDDEPGGWDKMSARDFDWGR